MIIKNATLALCAAVLLVSPVKAQQPSATAEGLRDRILYEEWFSTLSGDYQAGADYWAAHRSEPKASCVGTGLILEGCLAAKTRLTPLDFRRKSEPDYKTGWNSYKVISQPDTSLPDAESEIALDKLAEKLAVKAAHGDQDSLYQLETEAGKGSPSAEFGLAEYYWRLRSLSGPSSERSILVDQISHYDQSFKNYLQKREKEYFANPNDQEAKNDALQRHIVLLLESAVSLKDPAAESKLGAEIVAEVLQFQALLDRIGPSSDRQPLIQAERDICPRAIKLLSDADAAGWPAAPTVMMLLWASGQPGVERLASGCAFPQDLGRVQQLLTRSAERGYPDAIYSLILGAREKGDYATVKRWEARLNDEAAADTPDASELLSLLNK